MRCVDRRRPRGVDREGGVEAGDLEDPLYWLSAVGEGDGEAQPPLVSLTPSIKHRAEDRRVDERGARQVDDHRRPLLDRGGETPAQLRGGVEVVFPAERN